MLQIGQEEEDRAGSSHRALPRHQVPVAAGNGAGQGLRAQPSARKQLSDVSWSMKSGSTRSTGWACSHPALHVPLGQGRDKGL